MVANTSSIDLRVRHGRVGILFRNDQGIPSENMKFDFLESGRH